MDAAHIRTLVESQISHAGGTIKRRGLDLRKALVLPQRITVIERFIQGDKAKDQLHNVWLVFVEDTEPNRGYRIVAAEDGSMFGLATEGFPTDKHLVLCAWYDDFMTALRAI